MVDNRTTAELVLPDDSKHLRLTEHARLRAAQWNLAIADLLYCLCHASTLHRQGDCFRILRICDIPPEHRDCPRANRLAGTVLVMTTSGWIKTVYRDPRASRKIRRKPEARWGFRPRGASAER